MKRYYVLTLLLLIFTTNLCFAEVKEIIADYTYNMGSGETPTGAEDKAILNAKRIAIEQAGTYIESRSEVVNNQLTKDDIKSVAAGILQTTVLEKRFYTENNAVFIYVKIKAVADTTKINSITQNRGYLEDIKKLQEQNTQLLQQAEQLKQQISNPKDREIELARNEQLLRAAAYYELGHQSCFNQKNYPVAVSYFSKALELNPRYKEALLGRAVAYHMLGDTENMLADLNQVLIVDPENGLAYSGKALIYYQLKQYDKALINYKMALRYLPRYQKYLLNTAEKRIKELEK